MYAVYAVVSLVTVSGPDWSQCRVVAGGRAVYPPHTGQHAATCRRPANTEQSTRGFREADTGTTWAFSHAGVAIFKQHISNIIKRKQRHPQIDIYPRVFEYFPIWTWTHTCCTEGQSWAGLPFLCLCEYSNGGPLSHVFLLPHNHNSNMDTFYLLSSPHHHGITWCVFQVYQLSETFCHKLCRVILDGLYSYECSNVLLRLI